MLSRHRFMFWLDATQLSKPKKNVDLGDPTLTICSNGLKHEAAGLSASHVIQWEPVTDSSVRACSLYPFVPDAGEDTLVGFLRRPFFVRNRDLTTSLRLLSGDHWTQWWVRSSASHFNMSNSDTKQHCVGLLQYAFEAHGYSEALREVFNSRSHLCPY